MHFLVFIVIILLPNGNRMWKLINADICTGDMSPIWGYSRRPGSEPWLNTNKKTYTDFEIAASSVICQPSVVWMARNNSIEQDRALRSCCVIWRSLKCAFLRQPSKFPRHLHGYPAATVQMRAIRFTTLNLSKPWDPWDNRASIVLLHCRVYHLCPSVCEVVYGTLQALRKSYDQNIAWLMWYNVHA